MYKLEADFLPQGVGLTGVLKVYRVKDVCNPQLCLTVDVTIQEGSTSYTNFRHVDRRFRLHQDNGQETRIAKSIKTFIDTYYQGYKRSHAYAWLD